MGVSRFIESSIPSYELMRSALNDFGETEFSDVSGHWGPISSILISISSGVVAMVHDMDV